MRTLPALPAGAVAQPASHRDIGQTCYELHRVYDAAGRLDQGRSFWLVTPLDRGDRPELGALSYAAYREAFAGRTLPFALFAAAETPAALIDEWLAAPPPPRRRGLRRLWPSRA